jgi:hypothetical protein
LPGQPEKTRSAPTHDPLPPPGAQTMRRVTLTFVLNEAVTPDQFARRIALACAVGEALRPGEGVALPSNPTRGWIRTEPRGREESERRRVREPVVVDDTGAPLELRDVELPPGHPEMCRECGLAPAWRDGLCANCW